MEAIKTAQLNKHTGKPSLGHHLPLFLVRFFGKHGLNLQKEKECEALFFFGFLGAFVTF